MILNDLQKEDLAIINYINTDFYVEELYRLMKMGIVPGLEIRKVGEIATCAEYRVEGCSSTIIIDKCLGDHIFIDKLDETLD